MKESEPPWVTVEISERAKRMQELCDSEIKRRTGIPREHWKYVGLEAESRKRATKVPYLKIVEAEIEEVPTHNVPKHGGGNGGPTWDFYFFIGSTGLALILGSYVVIDVIISWVRNL